MPKPDKPEEIDQLANMLGMRPVLGKPGVYEYEPPPPEPWEKALTDLWMKHMRDEHAKDISNHQWLDKLKDSYDPNQNWKSKN